MTTRTDQWEFLPEQDLDSLREVGYELLRAGRPVDARTVLRAFYALGGDREILPGALTEPDDPATH